MRTLIKDTVKKSGKKVTLMGWVSTRRDHGKLIFIDLRDASGMVQVVFLPQEKKAHALANTIRPEWVVKITGEVADRPDNMVNTDIPTGSVEVKALKLEILNEAETPAIDVDTDGLDINEETRLKYRYIDLRRPRLQANIRRRHEITQFIRNWLTKNDFTEIETPILTKATPEGARDFLVPSRQNPGKAFALPQAPQQYKQLLMASGFERYFQIARCFRDEDTRGDRQPEFTQLDMELSFVTREDVMKVNEDLLIKLVETLYPKKTIQTKPFPVLTYAEAMEKYGTDRPDLREDKNNPNLLAFCWVIDFPFFEKGDDGQWTFTHNPFSAPKPEFMKDLLAKENIGDIITSQYDVALNGNEIGGGSIRNHQPEALRKVLEIIGISDDDIEADFNHMLKAFSSGTPPHGGIAWGLDRLVMLLQNEPNIREVNAFPKTGDARDPMMDAPSPVTDAQLKELGLKKISSDQK